MDIQDAQDKNPMHKVTGPLAWVRFILSILFIHVKKES
jgi:hypothetical protein